VIARSTRARVSAVIKHADPFFFLTHTHTFFSFFFSGKTRFEHPLKPLQLKKGRRLSKERRENNSRREGERETREKRKGDGGRERRAEREEMHSSVNEARKSTS